MLAQRVRTLVAVVVAVLLIIGVGSYAFVRHMRVQQAELKSEQDRRAAEAEANRKLEEAGKQRLAAEQERQARAAAEAEANEPKPKREHATLPSSAKAIQILRPATTTGPSPITTRPFDKRRLGQ
jgi:uncharacterized protein HemX